MLLAHHILLDKVSRTRYLAIKGGGGFVEKISQGGEHLAEHLWGLHIFSKKAQSLDKKHAVDCILWSQIGERKKERKG